MSVTRNTPLRLSQAFIGAVGMMAGVLLLVACSSEPSEVKLPATLSGVVNNANGPVANAIVQIQGTPNRVTTDASGAFSIHGDGLGTSKAITLTAWAGDHYTAWVQLNPQDPVWKDNGNAGRDIKLTLQPIFDRDNHQYNWFSFDGKSGSASCGICHREYKEWQGDMHSQSAVNPRFISMFRGSHVDGRRGTPTQMVTTDKALPPDPNLPYYGPGFRLDNPNYAGTCAACHAPMSAKTPTTNTCAWSGCHSENTADRAQTALNQDIRGVMPVGMEGIALEGIACEFCHNIRNVIVDPITKMPTADMPGIMSLQLRRPTGPEHKLFFGTLSDTSRDGVTYLPTQSESQFCAACHFGKFGGVVSNMKMTGGTVIYNSYGEWLDSPYSNPDTGKTCQNCHMPKKDTQYSVFPDRGGVARDYVTYHDHTMTGPSTSQTLMWSAVKLNSTATRDGEQVRVNIEVINDNTGHAVPTDAPMRSVMLVVEANDANGKPLTRLDGPILPAWTGNYSGQSGKGFARILRDDWTGESPTAAFWRKTTVIEDTRLFPFKPDQSNYSFALPSGATGTVKVKLVYRRAFQVLAQQKGWTDPDIIMAEVNVPVQ